MAYLASDSPYWYKHILTANSFGLSNLMKFLRSLSEYWLAVHIGSWMLLTLFVSGTGSGELPPQWMLFYAYAPNSPRIGNIFLLVSFIGFLTSGILYTMSARSQPGKGCTFYAVLLLILPFACIIFTLALVGPESQFVTHLQSVYVDDREYHLLRYPRSFFWPANGNYFQDEMAFVLYACNHNDWGCEAAYYESRDGWILNPFHAEIVVVEGAIELYIDRELVYRLLEQNPVF
jgi:hypothetical protein